MTMNTNNSSTHYPIASLYVGDLAPDVTEAVLFEKFSSAGPVLSIRVCRDIITRRSLGYAYVNYQNSADAERAIDTLNFEKLAAKPIRIMWSQRDPSLRRSGLGNIFIKNLDKMVDNKVMFDTFSVFGNILSCKVSYDDKGQSKGYGFVHFDTEEAANSAITNLNGKIVNNRKIYVGKFVSRKERETKVGGHRRFTNVYVKNLPIEEYGTDEKLNDLFAPYGTITSAVVVKDDAGKSKGFGFVCFASAEGAESAVDALNGKDVGVQNKPLYVGRAQKKAEREAELKRKLEVIKAERINRSQGVNLYVKNLEDTLNDERLQKEFSAFGTITSAKVMTDDKGQSKGFGFVCFSTPEEATKAVTEMNNRIIVSKPLYVTLAQRKADREAQKMNLRYSQTGVRPGMQQGMTPQGPMGHAQQMPHQFQQAGMPMPGAMQGHVMPGMHQQQQPYLMPVAPQSGLNRNFYNAGPGAGGPQVPGGPQAGGAGGPQGMRVNPRWGNQMGGPMGGRQGGGPGGSNYNPNYRGMNPGRNVPGGPQGQVARQNVPGASGALAGGGAAGSGVPRGQFFPQNMAATVAAGGAPQGRVPRSGGPAPIRGQKNMGGPMAGMPAGAGQQMMVNHAFMQQQQHQPAPAHDPNMSHEDQIQVLGEQLYPKVAEFNPEQAGKITGMLLEMEIAEILNMLESAELLKSKVDEAQAVLAAHRDKGIKE